ncbi:hypothetical protein PUN28_016150 [Cardiocondyla obscurior]|uniref:Uncharacterized protein n=1 Tax=Cardiocondyla obscurior TaxID=286306 RepID=A0AAW2EVI9_9HYME
MIFIKRLQHFLTLFRERHYYGLTILHSVDPAVAALAAGVPSGSFRNRRTNAPLFFPLSPSCPSHGSFSLAFLLVNSLTNRRHFAVKALTISRPDGARGKAPHL